MGIWSLVILALGMAIFLEGLPYFVAPNGVRRHLEVLLKMNDRALRLIGLSMMVAGLIVAYLATR